MRHVDIERKRACSSCFACSAVCKRGAVTISQDENGFYKPFVDTAMCVNCGVCRKVCYSHIDLQSREITLKGYYGWHRDPNVLKQSASGGITSAIAQVAIEAGYIIIGCTYEDREKKAKHIIIKKQEQIRKILGSKYFQSDLSDLFSAVKELPMNTKMVFFGMPCQVLGVRKFLEHAQFDMKNVLLVELFCHGIVSPLVWKSYREQIGIKGVKDIRFRTKAYGWHVPVNEFITDQKSIPTDKSGDDFFTAYYSTGFFNRSCYKCQIKREFVNCDLRIGDFWGERFAKDRKGVSCILASSRKGEQMLERCKPYFCLYDANPQEILSAQSYNKDHFFDEAQWNENFDLLRRFGLKYSLRNMNKRKPIVWRLKRAIYIQISNIRSNFHKTEENSH